MRKVEIVDEMIPGWITVQAAAKVVGKTTGNIYNRISAKRFPVRKAGGRLWVHEKTMLRWFDEHGRNTRSEGGKTDADTTA